MSGLRLGDHADAAGEFLERRRIVERHHEIRIGGGYFLSASDLDQILAEWRFDLVDQARNELRQTDAIEDPFAGLQNPDAHAARDYSELSTPENSSLTETYRHRAEPGITVAIKDGKMRVRLIRKLADEIDGIDLSHCHVGDTLNLPWRHGQLLIAEGWAKRDRRGGHRSTVVLAFRRATDLGHWPFDDADEFWRAS